MARIKRLITIDRRKTKLKSKFQIIKDRRKAKIQRGLWIKPKKALA